MVQDAASISEYGLKPMQIDETDTQLIKDAAQALQLATSLWLTLRAEGDEFAHSALHPAD